ncbi:hypothetical protein FOA52_001916 [Chlamydomonas sp. UWO 241]|nr:hypothetical protein FOA52_001916 [Chlamydomonas sp. UWO 241]
MPGSPVMGVRLAGLQFSEMALSNEQAASLAAAAGDWMPCPIANAVGIPLMLLQLAGPRTSHDFDDEGPAVLSLARTTDGMAPACVQLNGVGPALLARWDLQAWTVDEMRHLHDYHYKTMSLMSDWMEEEGAEGEAAKEAFLTPAAFALHRSPTGPGGMPKQCATCFMSDEELGRPLLRCRRCTGKASCPRYCDAECQRKDWPEHKLECKAP